MRSNALWAFVLLRKPAVVFRARESPRRRGGREKARLWGMRRAWNKVNEGEGKFAAGMVCSVDCLMIGLFKFVVKF